jgi:DNA repair ATPase RecN
MSEEKTLDVNAVILRELVTIRKLVSEALFAMREAEAEVPEKMRRFIMYMHDMHDVKNLYDEHGLPCPGHVLREVERCDDRLRQILESLHTDGGAFEKVRAEMAKDPNNRYEHTRQLAKPQEPK